MSLPGEVDEATTRDQWRTRPMIGDIVESIDGPHAGPRRRHLL
jgi:hypothetical protein